MILCAHASIITIKSTLYKEAWLKQTFGYIDLTYTFAENWEFNNFRLLHCK